MSEIHLDGMYETMLAKAQANGPYGVAFLLPVEPKQLREETYATIYLFHSDSVDLWATRVMDSRLLCVYAAIAATRRAKMQGMHPRLIRW